MTKPPEETELTQIAREIEEVGKADNVSSALMKGMLDGVNGIITLLNHVVPLTKGKSGDEPTNPDDKGNNKPKTETEPAAGDGAPGYQDMLFGTGGDLPIPSADDSGRINVANFLKGVRNGLLVLAKGQDAGTKRDAEIVALIKAQNSRIDALETLVRGSIEAQAKLAAPLAKAVAELSIAVHDIPAAPTTPTRGKAPKARVDDAKPIGGDGTIEKRTLAKALSQRLLTEGERRHFHVDRRFSSDDAEHTRIRAKLEELAKSIPA